MLKSKIKFLFCSVLFCSVKYVTPGTDPFLASGIILKKLVEVH